MKLLLVTGIDEPTFEDLIDVNLEEWRKLVAGGRVCAFGHLDWLDIEYYDSDAGHWLWKHKHTR